MKGLVNNFILICIVAKSYGCKQEWDPTCKTDKDCCSKKCLREPAWENGFCFDGKNQPPLFDECKKDYFEGCIVNEQCCSKLCNRSPYDQYGRCTPKSAVFLVPESSEDGTLVSTCENDGFANCTEDNQCCSGICEKKGYRKNSVCKSSATTPQPEVPPCLADWSATSCSKNEDCCSRLCSSAPASFGTCISSTTGQEQPQSSRSCRDDLRGCSFSFQCCSGICEKQKNQRFGTCKVQTNQPPTSTPDHELGQVTETYPSSRRTSTESSGTYSAFGQPRTQAPRIDPDQGQVPIQEPYPSNRPCKPNNYRNCTEHSQCCSSFCQTERFREFGICKPFSEKPREEPKSKNCSADWTLRCVNNQDCCSGYCKKYENFNVCKPPPSSEPEINSRNIQNATGNSNGGINYSGRTRPY